jgi:aryl-alcohol dehydrogenase-like predicted oxidoreductase
VQDFYDAAKAYNCVLPTVYEGSYSAVGRLAETDLIPLLHKLGIAYNAYSPIAGGLLAKSKEEFLNGASRFNNSTVLGVLYNSIFNRPSYLTALDAWGDISKDSGLPKAELAFRWVVYHSILSGKHGDGIIFGARDATQLRDTIRIIQAGPLPDNVVKRIDAVWDIVKGEAVLDNWLGYWKAILEG